MKNQEPTSAFMQPFDDTEPSYVLANFSEILKVQEEVDEPALKMLKMTDNQSKETLFIADMQTRS